MQQTSSSMNQQAQRRHICHLPYQLAGPVSRDWQGRLFSLDPGDGTVKRNGNFGKFMQMMRWSCWINTPLQCLSKFDIVICHICHVMWEWLRLLTGSRNLHRQGVVFLRFFVQLHILFCVCIQLYTLYYSVLLSHTVSLVCLAPLQTWFDVDVLEATPACSHLWYGDAMMWGLHEDASRDNLPDLWRWGSTCRFLRMSQCCHGQYISISTRFHRIFWIYWCTCWLWNLNL